MLRTCWLAGAALLLASPPMAIAQSIGVVVGDSARVQVTPSSALRIPLRLEFPTGGTTNVASITSGVSWDPARLVFDSLRSIAATGFTATVNSAGATSGSLTFTAYGTTGLTTTGAFANLYFRAATGNAGTRVRVTPTAAGSQSGTSVLAALTTRGMDVCVAPLGRWGDGNDDGTVNILDAQQIARFTIGLSVANATALTGRGDVTNDGVVNILDAQQLARFTIGLSAAARINTALYTAPTVSTLTLTPSGAQSLVVGNTLALSAVARDAGGANLVGCVPTSFTSASPTVASISADGVVTGVSAGSATVTATSGSVSVPVAVTVAPPYTLQLARQPATGTSNDLLPVQPVIEVRDLANAIVTEPRVVSASIASGTGTLSGITSVTTVNGVATFSNLAITGTGAHTLRFSSTGLADRTGSSMTVAAPTTMRVLVGATPYVAGTAATDVAIPINVDLTGRGTDNLAGLTVILSWDPARFTYVSNAAGNWTDNTGGASTVLVNTDSVAFGRFKMTGYTTDATTTAGFTMRSLTLRPVTTGSVIMGAVVKEAGNVSGQPVSVTVRNLGGTVVNGAGIQDAPPPAGNDGP